MKSPDLGSITSEILKVDLETSTEVYNNLFQHIWKYDTVPNDWAKDCSIIKLHKTEDLSDCNYWRDITLLPVPTRYC